MIYQADLCCVFNKTNEPFGELSNMCAGFILRVKDKLYWEEIN
jgi:hypothetical protein